MVVDNSGHVKRFERLTPLTYDNGSLFNHSTTIESFKAELSTTTRADPYICGETGAMRNGEYPRRFPTISSNLQASDLYAARRHCCHHLRTPSGDFRASHLDCRDSDGPKHTVHLPFHDRSQRQTTPGVWADNLPSESHIDGPHHSYRPPRFL